MKTIKSRAKDPTHAVFGKTPVGDTLDIPLSSGPHWLICGETNSGKSVFANAILISLMVHNHPDQLKMTWIDPKRVEAGAYVGLPFCPIDPVTDMNDAYGLVQYYVYEMERRYALLESAGKKKLVDYNAWIDQNPDKAEAGGHVKLPFMICVIDEYADLVMQVKDAEEGIVRLGQKARAAGIHLLIMTQRPSASIISPTLKANIPGRVCLKVADFTNSSIIIDQPGGEKLRGFGDGLVKWGSSLERVQGAFISDDEIAAIFSELSAKYGAPEPLDYKQIVVDEGLCEWAEEYDDSVPDKDRHVKQIKRSRYR